ncbi:MAG: hypothetical protein IPH04_10660 [Saprospirales bacterium]|nr:hypothetical protein [Saprospirales bacterium]
MIGGGVLLVVVLAVWGISSGKGKSAELAAAQDGQDTIQVSVQEDFKEKIPERLESTPIQKQPAAKDPAMKKIPESLSAGKPAAASIGANGLSFDGKTYHIYPFKGLTWMAQNLDFEVSGSWCYGGNAANCQKYGRLYSWAAAKKPARPWAQVGACRRTKSGEA